MDIPHITNKECKQALISAAGQLFISKLAQTHDFDFEEYELFMKTLIKVVHYTTYYMLKHSLNREVTEEDYTPENIDQIAQMFRAHMYLMSSQKVNDIYQAEIEKTEDSVYFKTLQKYIDSVLKMLPQFPKFTPKTES